MGTRLSFYLGSPDGVEGLFWQSGPLLFRDWARYVEEQEPGTFSADLLDRLDRIVADGPGSLVPRDVGDAAIVDQILDSFVGQYCDGPARSLLKLASESVVNVRWYRLGRSRIETRCAPQTRGCWTHLLDGRAVGRAHFPCLYAPGDPVFRLGYWTAQEVLAVHTDLCASFPAVIERAEDRCRGGAIRAPDDEVAIEIAVEATAGALREETGLITTVA